MSTIRSFEDSFDLKTQVKVDNEIKLIKLQGDEKVLEKQLEMLGIKRKDEEPILTTIDRYKKDDTVSSTTRDLLDLVAQQVVLSMFRAGKEIDNKK